MYLANLFHPEKEPLVKYAYITRSFAKFDTFSSLSFNISNQASATKSVEVLLPSRLSDSFKNTGYSTLLPFIITS